jgi:hypothetical protein
MLSFRKPKDEKDLATSMDGITEAITSREDMADDGIIQIQKNSKVTLLDQNLFQMYTWNLSKTLIKD